MVTLDSQRMSGEDTIAIDRTILMHSDGTLVVVKVIYLTVLFGS